MKKFEKSVSQNIRTLIEAGHSNKYIVSKLQCNPRTVYNMRYRVNKDRGIAALSINNERTGINEPAITFVGPEPIDWKFGIYVVLAILIAFVLILLAIVIGGVK